MAGLCIVALQGCGLFRNPSADILNAMQARNPSADILNGMRAIRKERVVNVTVMGGAQLNPGRTGLPRPVQLCVYLVADQHWLPGSWLDKDKCRTSNVKTNSHIFANERRSLAPEQAQQVTLKMPSDRDGWVLVDADFGTETAANRKPLRIKINSGEFSFHFVIINNTRVFDGMDKNQMKELFEANHGSDLQ